MTPPRNTDEELGIRPLAARSVLLSTLLGLDPPVLPTARLVATARLLGIEEGTARVALSRMVAAGEVVAEGGRYALTGRLLERQRRQLTGRRPTAATWRGGWHVAVVTATRRPARERNDLRAALTAGRLAEWREGVWARPDNLDRPALAAGVADHVHWLESRPDGDPTVLAAALWDLDAWASTARGLLARLQDPAPTQPDDLAPGFMLAAAVLRHLTADPQLPAALLPAGWPGARLREAYETWDGHYQATLRGWHVAHP